MQEQKSASAADIWRRPAAVEDWVVGAGAYVAGPDQLVLTRVGAAALDNQTRLKTGLQTRTSPAIES